MTTATIAVVLGNRPQFIKHAAINTAWVDSSPKDATMVVIDTGQHYDYELAGLFLDELEIPAPHYSLGVGSASHPEQLARMMPALEEVYRQVKPCVVVTYGDTNSTLGGALTAAQMHIPVAHIEAGLRSGDRTMPEELNRVLVDHMSDLLFAPTEQAQLNLRAEGLPPDRVVRVGDVMADIAIQLAPAADGRWQNLADMFGVPEDEPYGVLTIHREASTSREGLEAVIECLKVSPVPLYFPVHPRTQYALERVGLHLEITALENVVLLPPLGYLDLAALVRRSDVVVTDSGGLQKEALVNGVPCVTMRSSTEWVETVEAGANRLVGFDVNEFHDAVQDAVSMSATGAEFSNPYGSGDAGSRIVAALLEFAAQRRLDSMGL